MFERWFGRGYKYENTRQYLRLPAAWPIKCEPQTAADSTHVVSTKDVGAGGIAVEMQQMVPVGSRIRIEIHVPPLNRSIQAMGQVVRCLPKPDGRFELGIRFQQIEPQEQTALNEAIQKFLPRRHASRKRSHWWRKVS